MSNLLRSLKSEQIRVGRAKAGFLENALGHGVAHVLGIFSSKTSVSITPKLLVEAGREF